MGIPVTPAMQEAYVCESWYEASPGQKSYYPNKVKRNGAIAQMVEYLLVKHKALCSITSTNKRRKEKENMVQWNTIQS